MGLSIPVNHPTTLLRPVPELFPLHSSPIMADTEFKSEVTKERDYDPESSSSSGTFHEVKLQRQLKNRHVAMIRYAVSNIFSCSPSIPLVSAVSLAQVLASCTIHSLSIVTFSSLRFVLGNCKLLTKWRSRWYVAPSALLYTPSHPSQRPSPWLHRHGLHLL